METIVDFRSFDERFKTALVFSIFEGLLNGKEFVLVSDEEPSDIRQQFQNANVSDIDFSKSTLTDGVWKTTVTKKNKNSDQSHSAGGCCGMCHGEKK